MINSITNTQTIIIDEFKKIEKDLPKPDRSLKNETSKSNTETEKSDNETKTQHQPNYANIAKELEDLLEDNSNVRFELVELKGSESLVFTVTDKDTGEVLKQLPSETSIKIMQYLYEKYGVGQITNEQV